MRTDELGQRRGTGGAQGRNPDRVFLHHLGILEELTDDQRVRIEAKLLERAAIRTAREALALTEGQLPTGPVVGNAELFRGGRVNTRRRRAAREPFQTEQTLRLCLLTEPFHELPVVRVDQDERYRKQHLVRRRVRCFVLLHDGVQQRGARGAPELGELRRKPSEAQGRVRQGENHPLEAVHVHGAQKE